ncbi:cell wall-binding repeat-containing protein, partial [Quadrisphaera oryzae]|uniref:cell wall-binding repeat-containing protein n=1 Tax=Quadrisphaera oryzae TaxID=2509661 RepID=UPI004044E379
SSRIAGDDRYGTAIAASQAAFKDGSAQNVVIVNGYATVDGLTASYLAGVANAPILYVDQNGANDATKAELKRLGAKNIWLVGGTTVIPQSVQDAMSGAGYTVNRINGSDRYETAKLIAEAGAKISGKQPSKVFVASGTSFADALAVSPIAYAKGYAIALTDKDSTSDFTKKELGNIGTNTKILVGGTAVVSDAVAKDLTVSQRVAGDDRGVTANLIADWANANEGFNASQAALVGGTNGNGADSLVGASVLGKTMTALHFAGWDSTTTWFKDHSAQLTGAGVIFGGKAAVSDSQVSVVQSAAQSVAAAVGMVVTAASSTGFSYADAASQGAKKVTFKSSDKYVVSGSAATQGAFVSSLAVGATVSINVAADGSATYSLTPLTSTGYSTGLIGAFDTGSGSGHHNFTVVEPITGVALPFLSASATQYDYTTGGAYVSYTVDGQSVSQGIFEGAISLGDSITVTGTGADLNHIRTVALVSGSLTGTVAAVNTASGVITAGGSAAATGLRVKTTAGATFDVPLPGSGDGVSIDGTASTVTAFNGTTTAPAVTSPVSVGDQITYAKAGGVQKFTLVNSAPSKLAGYVSDQSGAYASGVFTADNSTLKYWSPAGTLTSVSYSNVSRFVVDGTVASKTDFVAALTAGDAVVYQPADTTTNTVSSLTLTSKPLMGTVAIGDASSANHTVTVADADGDTVATTVRYDLATSIYSAGTGSNVYTIDGTTATLAQFDAMVGRIASGARQGTVQASINSGTVTWALSTTTFSAAPVIVSASSAHTTTITVTFNKPVNNASAANADWTVTGATLGSTAPAWSNNNTTLTLTLSAATTAGNAYSVAPASAAKAALYTDTYGTALGTSSISFNAS